MVRSSFLLYGGEMDKRIQIALLLLAISFGLVAVNAYGATAPPMRVSYPAPTASRSTLSTSAHRRLRSPPYSADNWPWLPAAESAASPLTCRAIVISRCSAV